MSTTMEQLHKDLISLYDERKEDIKARLLDFKRILEEALDERIFEELCFCLCTPQSEAKTCWDAVEELARNRLLFEGTSDQLVSYLSKVRFGESKAKYIVQARELFTKEENLKIKSFIRSFTNPFELREWLVENVKGLGMKEAGHFLRNIGLGEDFAILDRHILRNLSELKVIEDIPASLTKKRYLEIEGLVRHYSRQLGIPMGELDLLLWSKETGWIFK